MNFWKKAASILLLLIVAIASGSFWLTHDPASQDRDHILASSSSQYPLGTDELGRDNLNRILAGLRTSLALAAVASLLACVTALIAGALAGCAGGWVEHLLVMCINLVDSVPWFFLFVSVRALLPLNASPSAITWMTFLMLAMLGWTPAARVFQAVAHDFRNSELFIFSMASGISGWRLWWGQAGPVLRDTAFSQFILAVPNFVLAESGLGLLGLGVPEPQPSLGNLLRQLQHPDMIRSHPVVLAPLAAMVLVVLCLRAMCGEKEATA